MVKEYEKQAYNKAINDAREILIKRGEEALDNKKQEEGLALIYASVAISKLFIK